MWHKHTNVFTFFFVFHFTVFGYIFCLLKQRIQQSSFLDFDLHSELMSVVFLAI